MLVFYVVCLYMDEGGRVTFIESQVDFYNCLNVMKAGDCYIRPSREPTIDLQDECVK